MELPANIYQSVDVACAHLFSIYCLGGTNDKIEYIRKLSKLSKSDDESAKLTMFLLKILVDPQLTTGLKKIQPPGTHVLETITSAEEVMSLVDKLMTSNINQTLRNEVNALLSNCEYKTATVLTQVLQKTFKIGVTAKSINKVVPGFTEEIKCMLADSPDDTTKLKYPVRVDIKYDGVRCLAKVDGNNVTLFTRQGKKLTFPAISKELKKLANGLSCVFDGELELVSGARTGISGLVNSNIQSGYNASHDILVKYTIFDIINIDAFNNQKCTTPQQYRQKSLSVLFINTGTKLQNVFECKYSMAYDEDTVMQITNKYIEEGLEGTIVKDLNATYQFKRSDAWLKHKAINSCTLVCVGTTSGTNKRQGKIGALIMKSQCGKLSVKVGGGIDDADIDLYTKVSPVGKYFEVLFNCVIESDGGYSLFLPRLSHLKMRIDKSEADTLAKILKEHIGKPQLKGSK